jgi:hypothetical protein
MAIEIPAAIRPYSIAVAPESSAKKWRSFAPIVALATKTSGGVADSIRDSPHSWHSKMMCNSRAQSGLAMGRGSRIVFPQLGQQRERLATMCVP